MNSQKPRFKSPQTLMVQGASSDAGKSILCTALCRILARHKIEIVPFKPQNMALNSAVTREGGEIGRAQAVQAQACFLEPSITMNPVLLKPNSETGAQVIVNGRAIGNMKAQSYHRYKPKLLKEVVSAHQQLQEEYEVVLVEGAGSPAEINLREHDIANMGFAEAVDCPVIIVADIEKGGVFAHLYGTWALLSESEQARIVGFVINRFRGDAALLTSGLEWLEQRTGVPVLAVMPFLPDLHIEAEDSIAQFSNKKASSRNESNNTIEQTETLKIAVVHYPRTSNHTDFDVLRMHPQINCEFIRESSQYTGADVIILPGTKSVRQDLQWLLEQGWLPLIQRHLRLGGKVIGVCGGFQMLGDCIHDPKGIEGEVGSSDALGFITMETTLTDNKILKQIEGHLINNKIAIKGYEIHAGVSEGEGLKRAVFEIEGQYEGAWSNDNSVMGSYIHGLFDQPDFLSFIMQWAGRGINPLQCFDYPAYREQQINRLADEVEKVMPLGLLKDLLGLSDKTCR